MITVEDVRQAMRLPRSIQDDVVEDVIRRAVARLRAYCRWHVFPEREETVTLSTNGSASVLLPSLRVLDVSRVAIGGWELDTDAYGVDRDGRLRLNGGRRFPDMLGGLEVTMRHGYAEDDVDDVRDVLLSMVERVLTLPHFIKQSSTGDASVTYGADAALRPTFGDKEVLDEYRIVVQ